MTPDRIRTAGGALKNNLGLFVSRTLEPITKLSKIAKTASWRVDASVNRIGISKFLFFILSIAKFFVQAQFDSAMVDPHNQIIQMFCRYGYLARVQIIGQFPSCSSLAQELMQGVFILIAEVQDCFHDESILQRFAFHVALQMELEKVG